MEKITLPGGLPGLLRRGSPVFWPAYTELTKDEMTQFVVIYASGALCLVSNFEATREVFSEYLSLDLEDPTGRQHAIWWLAQNAKNKFGPLTYDSLHCVYWDHMEYARYAIRSERTSDESDWLNSIIAFTFNVRAEYDLHIIELESLKGIPVELMSAKALQIVCLHVAKGKGYI